VAARALGESPLAERDRVVFESLAPLRLRPGRKFDLRAFGAAEQRALQAGIEQGHAEIRAAAGRAGKTIDGWSYGERHLGNFGDDYLYRAATALNGLGALEPGEASTWPATPTRAAGTVGRQPLRAHLSGRRPAAGARPRSLAHVQLTPDGALLHRQSDRPLRHRRSHQACRNLPMARSLSVGTTGRRTARPTGCPPLPGPCAWCSGPMNLRKP
jgi:hypothetical protein